MKLTNTACLAALLLACPLATPAVASLNKVIHYCDEPNDSGKVVSSGYKEEGPAGSFYYLVVSRACSKDANVEEIESSNNEGIYGDGEAAMAYGSAAPAAFGMVKELAGMIIGQDPMKIEPIWEKLYKQTFWGQNGGPVFFAGMSAIDMALWDIKGKALNVPLHVLLGGKFRDNLRTYASQLQFGWGESLQPALTPEDYAKNSLKALDEAKKLAEEGK